MDTIGELNKIIADDTGNILNKILRIQIEEVKYEAKSWFNSEIQESIKNQEDV